jgi:hypothetical protein
MCSVRNLLALATVLLLTCGLLACAPPAEEADPEAAQAAAWAKLQEAKANLDAKRQELADLRAEIAGGDEEDSAAAGGEGDAGEGADAAESPEARLAALEPEVVTLGEEFIAQVIEFINSQDLYEGQELTEIQRAAFDLKAQEDVLVAQEYIDKAGNYQKAIDIYTTSLIADPDSEILKEARERAEELRYMTQERFAAAKKGMTEAEVREALGTPQPINVREYPERGVTAWFYPKAGRKAAAGVYYRKQGGVLKVYNVDFDAVAAEEGDEEEG